MTKPSRAAAPALIRAKSVIDAKIARKSASKGKSPKNPNGLALERIKRRLGRDGSVRPDALMDARQQADQVPELPLVGGGGPTDDGGIWQWEWLGPGNIGGRIRSILIDPDVPDRMWIGGVAGGIWVTNNAGASWSPVDDFMASLAVTSIVRDPWWGYLFAATGEGFTVAGLPGAGIFRSADNGVTWSRVQGVSRYWKYINRLAVNRSKLMAATDDGLRSSSDDGATWNHVGSGRFLDVKELTPSGGWDWKYIAGRDDGSARYSVDSGIQWYESVFVGHPSATAVRIATAPDDDGNGIVDDDLHVDSTGGFWPGDNILVGSGATAELTVVLSIEDADSFKVRDLQFPHAVDEPVASQPGGRVELAYAPSSPGVVYASMNVGGGTIWKSTDYGATFSIVSNTTDNYLGTQGGYDNTIWVAPDDANFVIVGGIDLWRSTNGGVSLTKISDWRNYHTGTSAHADHHIIVAHPDYGAGNRTVFVGNDGGIQRAADITTVSENSGWTSLANNLGITQFYHGAAARNGSVIIGGSQDNDTLRFRPSGGTEHWYQAETGDGGCVAVDYDDPDILYAEYIHLAVEKSTDGGESYSAATSGLEDAHKPNRALFIAPFVMSPIDPNDLVAGGSRIWRTSDAADTWNLLRPEIGPEPFPLCSTLALAVRAPGSTRIWAGYHDGTVSRTVDSMFEWVDVSSPPMPARFVTAIAVNPYSSLEAFVVFGGYESDSIWYTPDGGANWELRQGSEPTAVPDVQVNTVTFHPSDPNWVYVGTDVGVFASEDKGLTWNRTPRFAGAGHDGPVNTEVSQLFWQGDEYLIAATFGRGMFRARVLTVVHVDAAYQGPPEDGSLLFPYDTVTEGIDAAGHGTTMSIKAGDYDEANLTVFTKRGRVLSAGGLVRIR